ncbi:RagB/SusD family nutrient uptake outer membrane protein [Flavivirga jejuensis]|uniref:RagB/SusD family nutrient uptake outer membrane protein n=1 Tax=Flavivirga jejuensis TaxID=870487 RepID=A0ABT8WSH3_9FLAO|nr:RagB/SusD family nutrient uptake outer membrane protein [Flavivirga jejuensis]MDO5976132.1 RagB/SusD family nutrient uptake outer membrane protein [Flavivirga jejuensis]
MKKIIKYIKTLTIILLGVSCSEYLDVVPDNTVEVEHLFETKQKAISALATCYSFMPFNDHVNNSMQSAGDEFVPRLDPDWVDRNRGINIMRSGFQGANDPILNFWDGRISGTALYDGIRVCNTFLNSISRVPDITETERVDWIAQVKFLKGFYHFYLINRYGPIIIADENLAPSEDPESVKQYRQPVDTCFDYVINLFDEAIPDLDESRTQSYLGQIDKTIAMSIKAKVLMYAASPLFNGNSEFYGSFINEEGSPYFNLEEDPEKWKLALDATEEAIAQALSVGKSMYVYNQEPYFFDRDDWEVSGIMKHAYSLRFSIVEPWNNELIWGLSNINDRSSGFTFQTATNIRAEGSTVTSNAWQWMGVSHRMTELFYTKNGVPINDDKTFNYENRLSIGEIPEDDDYFRGYLQPLERTVNLYLNREPRFYAWLGTDRGIWRAQQARNNLKMRFGESPGGQTHATDYFWTGIGVKKFVHPETTSDQGWETTTFYPRAIMRLSELYLMRAEARNEYSGPEQRVYDDLNVIRTRAGIPNIETVYSDANIVKNTGKHTDKAGLRDIIHTERMIELSFEGHRYDDIRRWKRATQFFIDPILGWNVDKDLTSEFYELTTKQTRNWITPRDYLFPIMLNELRLNSNLIQNPGWDR